MYNEHFLYEIVLKMEKVCPKLDDALLHPCPNLVGRLAKVCSSSSGNLAQSPWPTIANIRSRQRGQCGNESLLLHCGVFFSPMWNLCAKHAHTELQSMFDSETKGQCREHRDYRCVLEIFLELNTVEFIGSSYKPGKVLCLEVHLECSLGFLLGPLGLQCCCH